MSHRYFKYKSLDDIRKEVERLHLDITFDENLDYIFKPVNIGDRVVGNAFAIHPMEGCDGSLDGKPEELTFRRWHRFAGGGAKLIWGEATAVVQEGRANPRQLCLNEKNLFAFEKLLSSSRAIHRERFGTDGDLLVGLQFTHSGRWSYQKPLIASHHPNIDAVTFTDAAKTKVVDADYPIVSDDYLEQLEDKFVDAAKLASKIGFDFIDIKQCHTYLLNELLSARIRVGKYGGSFENRTRFIRNVLLKINSELKDKIIIASRVNVFDGIPFMRDPKTGIGVPRKYDIPYRFGFGVDEMNPLDADLNEPIQLIAMMYDHGVRLFNISMGSPYFNPHIGRPYERPSEGSYFSPEHPLIGVECHFKLTEQIRSAFPDAVIVGTGYSWLQKYFINAAESNVKRKRVSIVGVGRAALAYPDFATDAFERGSLDSKRVCLTVSYCTDLMRSKKNELGQYPTGCVPRDDEYAEVYKEAKNSEFRSRNSE